MQLVIFARKLHAMTAVNEKKISLMKGCKESDLQSRIAFEL
jgi:hypothetical protein